MKVPLPSVSCVKGLWSSSTSCLGQLGPLSCRLVSFEIESVALLESILPASEVRVELGEGRRKG